MFFVVFIVPPKLFLSLTLLSFSLTHKIDMFRPLPLCAVLSMWVEAILTSVDATQGEIRALGLVQQSNMVEMLTCKNDIA